MRWWRTFWTSPACRTGIKLNCQVLDLVAEATDAALFVEARMQKEGIRLIYEESPRTLPGVGGPGAAAPGVCQHPGQCHQVFPSRRGHHHHPVPHARDCHRLHPGPGPGHFSRRPGKGPPQILQGQNSVRGSGIGLAVVDEIVAALGGTLDIASTLGEGTTVSVTLPLYRAGQEHLHDPLHLPESSPESGAQS